jgi:hypothetical protein
MGLGRSKAAVGMGAGAILMGPQGCISGVSSTVSGALEGGSSTGPDADADKRLAEMFSEGATAGRVEAFAICSRETVKMRLQHSSTARHDMSLPPQGRLLTVVCVQKIPHLVGLGVV